MGPDPVRLGVYSLPFRGQRNYVHGTSLFALLATSSSFKGSCRFKVHKMSSDNVVAIEHALRPNPNWTSWLSTEGYAERTFFGVLPVGIDTECREPYDEASIIQSADRTDYVCTTRGAGLPLLDVAVPLMKHLIDRRDREHKQAAGGQWVLTDFRTQLPSASPHVVEVGLDMFKPNYLSRAQVIADGQRSSLCFAWKPAQELEG